MSSTKKKRYEMNGTIINIKFSGGYDKLYDWKEQTKVIARHKGILKYPTKEWEIPSKEAAEMMKIN